MNKQVSFIHAADLHLDSPFKGLSHVPPSIFNDIRNSTFSTLDHLVQLAIEKKVNFVLLVGDLFDHEEQSLKAQIKLREACEQLKKHHIHVFISYGNHDYIHGNTHPVTYPDNVYIFPDEKIDQFIYTYKNQPLAAIYGFSYENQAVHANKAKEYTIKDHTIPFHIATLHGSIYSNKTHDTYAPFNLNDLMKENFDYWALGHIHKRQVLNESPPIVYSGNTQGRHDKELGEKGCYHVVLTTSGSHLSFVPLHTIQFERDTIDVSDCQDIYALEQTIRGVLKRYNKRTTPLLISLHLMSNDPKIYVWEQYKYIEEIIEVINEADLYEKNWIFIYQATVSLTHNPYHHLHKGDHFISELSSRIQKASIQPLLNELYYHRQGRMFLEQLTREDEEMIKEKAEQYLLNELLNSEDE